jgi:hypothetical protein
MKTNDRDVARRRGRPLRTPTRGFGAFLEGVMRLQHAVDAPGERITDYITRLYTSSKRPPGISPRHLMRLRTAYDMPNFTMLRRIAEIFQSFGDFDQSQPDQPRFKEELWIPRLGWPAVRQNWGLLPAGSDICLCMGLVPSWALERITAPIVQDIGLAILDTKRDLRFKLVFPQAPKDKVFLAAGEHRELTAEEILQDLQLSVTKTMLRAGGNTSALRNRIRTRLSAWEIAASPEAMYVWSRCPRVLMISNLMNRDSHAPFDFAAAYELNQVPYPASFTNAFEPSLPQPLTSAGWGYLLPQSHDRLRSLFRDLLKNKNSVRQANVS